MFVCEIPLVQQVVEYQQPASSPKSPSFIIPMQLGSIVCRRLIGCFDIFIQEQLNR